MNIQHITNSLQKTAYRTLRNADGFASLGIKAGISIGNSAEFFTKLGLNGANCILGNTQTGREINALIGLAIGGITTFVTSAAIGLPLGIIGGTIGLTGGLLKGLGNRMNVFSEPQKKSLAPKNTYESQFKKVTTEAIKSMRSDRNEAVTNIKKEKSNLDVEKIKTKGWAIFKSFFNGRRTTKTNA